MTIDATYHDRPVTDRSGNRDRALVRAWLYMICTLVAAIVVVGGATRLTDSGLSITEWNPVSGIIPPLNAEDWAREFDKYRTTTEYQTVNKGMSLDAFQTIFWWEWGHRFLARLIGLAFAVPLVFFWLTGRLDSYLKPRLLLLLALGGLQGLIGWWMVKSGLVNRVDVSQYRLAVHLTVASVIFAYAMWLARGLVRPQSVTASGAQRLSMQAGALCFLVLLQIALGGFVAGMDAGLAYNTWPLMDGALVPSGLMAADPWWSNVFESPKTAQFVHRMVAYLLLLAVVLHAAASLRSGSPVPASRRAVLLVVLMLIQAAMGIITLLMQVPMGWALAHQLGAIAVLGFAVAHWRALSLSRD